MFLDFQTATDPSPKVRDMLLAEIRQVDRNLGHATKNVQVSVQIRA